MVILKWFTLIYWHSQFIISNHTHSLSTNERDCRLNEMQAHKYWLTSRARQSSSKSQPKDQLSSSFSPMTTTTTLSLSCIEAHSYIYKMHSPNCIMVYLCTLNRWTTKNWYFRLSHTVATRLYWHDCMAHAHSLHNNPFSITYEWSYDDPRTAEPNFSFLSTYRKFDWDRHVASHA